LGLCPRLVAFWTTGGDSYVGKSAIAIVLVELIGLARLDIPLVAHSDEQNSPIEIWLLMHQLDEQGFSVTIY
jgi:hypothetical protein